MKDTTEYPRMLEPTKFTPTKIYWGSPAVNPYTQCSINKNGGNESSKRTSWKIEENRETKLITPFSLLFLTKRNLYSIAIHSKIFSNSFRIYLLYTSYID